MEVHVETIEEVKEVLDDADDGIVQWYFYVLTYILYVFLNNIAVYAYTTHQLWDSMYR